MAILAVTGKKKRNVGQECAYAETEKLKE